MENKKAKQNQSVEQTVRIIETMAHAGGAMRLCEIAEKAELPESTTLRMLTTLQKLGYINQNPDNLRYSLSLRFAYLGDLVSEQTDLPTIAHPTLLALSRETGCCVTLSVRHNDFAVHCDAVTGGGYKLTLTPGVSDSVPLYCTSTGRLFLLERTDRELKGYLQSLEELRYTDRTIITFEGLKKELEKVRAAGFSLDFGEYRKEMGSIAAPVRNYTGRIVAAVSLFLPPSKMNEETIAGLLGGLTHAAHEVSRALAFPYPNTEEKAQ